MRRGFKSQSEKMALDARKSCNQTAFDRFDPKKFLESLRFVIWSPSDIPGLSSEHVLQLTARDPDSWSGVTIREGNAAAIILNPTHPSTRQANTLMHEWAHVELRHKPNRVDRSKGGYSCSVITPLSLKTRRISRRCFVTTRWASAVQSTRNVES